MSPNRLRAAIATGTILVASFGSLAQAQYYSAPWQGGGYGAYAPQSSSCGCPAQQAAPYQQPVSYKQGEEVEQQAPRESSRVSEKGKSKSSRSRTTAKADRPVKRSSKSRASSSTRSGTHYASSYSRSESASAKVAAAAAESSSSIVTASEPKAVVAESGQQAPVSGNSPVAGAGQTRAPLPQPRTY